MTNPQFAQALLELANKEPSDRLETFRLAHDALDGATSVEELKPVLELILLKLF